MKGLYWHLTNRSSLNSGADNSGSQVDLTDRVKEVVEANGCQPTFWTNRLFQDDEPTGKV